MSIMMRDGKWRLMQRVLGIPVLGLTLALPLGSAHAQAPATQAQAPSTNAMVNLIRLLVKQGTITQANGDALLAQAETDAQQARSTITQAAANAGVPPPPEGTVRVPYVPETVRRQIADQVRTEVMAQAKSERWAAPDNAAPDWTRHIRISGDMRVRSESDFYARDNNTQLVNVAAINATAGGFNFTGDAGNLRFLNTTQDRINRLRLRARLAIDADIGPGVEAGFRLATGDDNSPISTNVNLGGGLSKRNVWLDRAFLRLHPTDWLMVEGGRFANPFVSPEQRRFADPFRSSEIMFDEDLNFDGISAEIKADKWLPTGFQLALRGGAFPLDFGSPAYPDTAQTKQAYQSKWLFSGQIAGSYTTHSGIRIAAGAAFHDFHNISGRLSSFCPYNGVNIRYTSNGIQLNDPVECSTDGSAAFSANKGNTYFFIRQLGIPDTDPFQVSPLNQRQLLGLTYKYQVLDLSASALVPVSEKVSAVLSGEYIQNLAFSHKDDCRFGVSPITNLAENGSGNACDATNPNPMVSGNKGWSVDLALGHAHPRKWGEWRLQAGYRYLQSDATLDSLVDSDFHLGGTNTKGYTIGARFGLMNGAAIGARWMSANEITGAPLSIDVLQIDLLAEF